LRALFVLDYVSVELVTAGNVWPVATFAEKTSQTKVLMKYTSMYEQHKSAQFISLLLSKTNLHINAE